MWADSEKVVVKTCIYLINQNENYEKYDKQMIHIAEFEVPELSIDEIEIIIKSLKNNKYPEEYNINS